MMKAACSVLVAVVGLGAFGCSSSSNSGSTATASDFCPTMVSALYALESRCLGGSESDWETESGGSAMTCAELTTAISAKRVAYDSSGASACLNGLGTVSCDSFFLAGSFAATGCASAIKGLVADGASC
jgi:hypothetical protein